MDVVLPPQAQQTPANTHQTAQNQSNAKINQSLSPGSSSNGTNYSNSGAITTAYNVLTQSQSQTQAWVNAQKI